MKITEVFHIHTTTPGNNRKHYMVEAKKAKEQRTMVANRFRYRPAVSPLPPFPVKVTFTRYSPRKMDKHNLPGALKHVVDGLCNDAYGIDDGDERWEELLHFEQAKGLLHEVKVEVEAI